MKYIKPPEFKSVKEFTEYYVRIENDITRLLTQDAGAKSSEELNRQFQKALSAAVSYLENVNKRFTNEELPKAFKEGKDGVTEPQKLTQKEVSAILEKQGFRYAKNAFSRDTYIELQTAVKSAGNGLKSRVNEIIKELRNEGKDSVYNVQQAILKDLQENGISIEYSNGAKQSLSSYAAMAARSARIESANIGAIGRALQAGTDFVKMTTMPQCCKYCGAYQDKVYCVSGKNKRFPALFKTVLKSGYALPHPNCRHEFIPWFEEMESPEDVEREIKNSKIKYNKDGTLADVRYQKDIESYAAWQAGNRQLNAEAKEYAEMQAYYKTNGEEPPYKTIGAFRRARRADELSPAFKAWRYRNVDGNKNKEIIDDILENIKIRKFVPSKTIKDAEEVAKINLGIQDVKYKGAKIDTANSVNEEIQKAIDIFGDLKNEITEVVIDTSRQKYAGMYNKLYGKLTVVQPSKFDIENGLVEKAAQRSFDTGWKSTNSTAHAVRHEIGHAVISKYKNDIDWDEISKIRKMVIEKSGIDFSKWSKEATIDEMKKAGKYVSYYALENDEEFIAECIAEYLNGNPRDTSEKVVKTILKNRIKA